MAPEQLPVIKKLTVAGIGRTDLAVRLMVAKKKLTAAKARQAFLPPLLTVAEARLTVTEKKLTAWVKSVGVAGKKLRFYARTHTFWCPLIIFYAAATLKRQPQQAFQA